MGVHSTRYGRRCQAGRALTTSQGKPTRETERVGEMATKVFYPFPGITVFLAMKEMGKENHKGGRLASDDKFMNSGPPSLAWDTLPSVMRCIAMPCLKILAWVIGESMHGKLRVRPVQRAVIGIDSSQSDMLRNLGLDIDSAGTSECCLVTSSYIHCAQSKIMISGCNRSYGETGLALASHLC